MINLTELVNLDDDMEEEAVIKINDIEFVTFISYVPYSIEVNKQYPVEISFFIDDVDIKESDQVIKSLIRNGNTFEYTVNGYLNEKGQLDVGFLIEDEILEEYQYLRGKYITFKVDRINSEFIVAEKTVIK